MVWFCPVGTSISPLPPPLFCSCCTSEYVGKNKDRNSIFQCLSLLILSEYLADFDNESRRKGRGGDHPSLYLRSLFLAVFFLAFIYQELH